MLPEEKLTIVHDYGIDIENREIYLHSHFAETEDGEYGVEYRSAVRFEKNIRHLNLISNDPILVHMHLPGGDWEDCLSIFDTIRSSKANIGILAYTKIASSSSVILQAPKLRVLMPNCHILIHYGSLIIDNEHKAAMSNFEWNEKESKKMIDIFTEKCLSSPIAEEKKWKRMIIKKHILSQLANKSDWILNAEESIYYGFADGILGSQEFPNIDTIKKKLKKS